MKNKRVVVFDLDDTLYKEIDFLKSAFKEIAKVISINNGHDVEDIFSDMMRYYEEKLNSFELVLKKYPCHLSIKDLLIIYRNHIPEISVSNM